MLLKSVSAPDLMDNPSALDPVLASDSWQTLMTFTREHARKPLTPVRPPLRHILTLVSSFPAANIGTFRRVRRRDGRRHPSRSLRPDCCRQCRKREHSHLPSLYVREHWRWKRLRCLWAAFVIVDRMSCSACGVFCRSIASLLECIVKDLVEDWTVDRDGPAEGSRRIGTWLRCTI